MSSPPLKPWEKLISEFSREYRDELPPPVPLRPTNSHNPNYYSDYPLNNAPYSPYSSGFSRYGSGLTGYGSGFSYFGSGVSSFGRPYYNNYNNNYGSNDFIHLAEQSCGPAFHSLESIVQSFVSVATMVESTYFAIHSSFQAVLAVAQHISSLRNHFATLAVHSPIIRFIQTIIKRLFLLIRLQRHSLQDEEWSKIFTSSRPLQNDSDPLNLEPSQPSSLPIMLFFSLLFGAPWLIWKLFASFLDKSNFRSNSRWFCEEDDCYIATALYDFTSQDNRELSFKKGDKIIIAPKEAQPRIRGWLLASINSKTGLIPNNYIKVIEFKRKNDINNSIHSSPK